MLAVVAYDPVPSCDAGRVVPALAAFARRHEFVLTCAEQAGGETYRLLAALTPALPRFRFVPMLADPSAAHPVDPRVLLDLLDDGAVPVAVAFAARAVSIGATLATNLGADTLLRVGEGPDGVALQETEWVPARPAAA